MVRLQIASTASIKGNKPTQGYVPGWIGIDGGEDYIKFKYCLVCGQIKGKWPVREIAEEIEEENKRKNVSKER